MLNRELQEKESKIKSLLEKILRIQKEHQEKEVKEECLPTYVSLRKRDDTL